ncbi:hypothetical protein [Dactylosporangium sp. NPDC049140]
MTRPEAGSLKSVSTKRRLLAAAVFLLALAGAGPATAGLAQPGS